MVDKFKVNTNTVVILPQIDPKTGLHKVLTYNHDNPLIDMWKHVLNGKK